MGVDLEFLSSLDGGLISTDLLRRSGVDPRGIERLVGLSELVRVRRGWYVAAAEWKAAGRGGRYRLLVRATNASSPKPLVAAHLSAAAMHRLPTIGDWPAELHTFEPGASGGSTSRLITTHRSGPSAETVVIDGVIVVALERTLVDLALNESPERAVTAIDAALRRDAERYATDMRRRNGEAHLVRPPLSKEALLTELDAVAPAFHRARAESVIRFADARAGSPGESLSRVRMRQGQFVIPELQVRFPNILGSYADVDFYLEGVRKVQEFDGKFKYTRGAFVKEGDDPGEVVWQEKQREDALRQQERVDSFDRWTWDTVLPLKKFRRFLLERGMPELRAGAQFGRRAC
ncbi:hypothetical protein WJX64_12700 [Leifsonia sp. YIM 134122]|uniref:Transcriptional regulator, AbiEi antitoxin, Type IV TA system n=1 Tax=Leifsonia stereocauli TaxID=3134136 RepID=A0ABU9W6Z8_9MICO